MELGIHPYVTAGMVMQLLVGAKLLEYDTKDKEEYFSDTLFIKPTDYFYIGLHARNTRRLPYNVEVDVGKFYISYDKMTESQRRLTPVQRPSRIA